MRFTKPLLVLLLLLPTGAFAGKNIILYYKSGLPIGRSMVFGTVQQATDTGAADVANPAIKADAFRVCADTDSVNYSACESLVTQSDTTRQANNDDFAAILSSLTFADQNWPSLTQAQKIDGVLRALNHLVVKKGLAKQ